MPRVHLMVRLALRRAEGRETEAPAPASGEEEVVALLGCEALVGQMCVAAALHCRPVHRLKEATPHAIVRRRRLVREMLLAALQPPVDANLSVGRREQQHVQQREEGRKQPAVRRHVHDPPVAPQQCHALALGAELLGELDKVDFASHVDAKVRDAAPALARCRLTVRVLGRSDRVVSRLEENAHAELGAGARTCLADERACNLVRLSKPAGMRQAVEQAVVGYVYVARRARLHSVGRLACWLVLAGWLLEARQVALLQPDASCAATQHHLKSVGLGVMGEDLATLAIELGLGCQPVQTDVVKQ
eukprot:444463-Prymnesium_polylepis.1